MNKAKSTQELKVVDRPEDWHPKYLDVVGVTFVTCLLVSNLAAVKLFNFGPFVFTGGIIVFPLNYIFGDILSEIYGFARTRRIIWAGLFANLFMAIMLWLAIQLPPAKGWGLQEAFAQVFMLVPRLVVASVLAYWAGELSNSIVLSKMKVWMQAKHLWMRTIGSTLVGEFVDTCIFVLIAFAGVFPSDLLLRVILSGWVFKVVYEAIATPITYVIVGYLKRLEGIEHFDRYEKYNPLKI
jgi:hypothetical protein